ncbi:ATP-binding protein [Streptomyces sp. NPDC059740]|uniref:ATP-binding protein n=1 Tax=Streptomyces sp. NPDC059740 TaxID=3346926 RepID=UPI00365920E4
MTPAVALAPSTAKPSPLTLRGFEVAMAPEPVLVARIRRIAATSLRRWAVPVALAEDVVVVVSELVTNAVEHGFGDVELRMRHHGGEVRVEVSDDNPAPARLRHAAEDETGGRGLFLVDVLARNWGVTRDGRTTWASFRALAEGP